MKQSFRDGSKGYVVESYPRNFAVLFSGENVFVMTYEKKYYGKVEFVCLHAASTQLVEQFEELMQSWHTHKTWSMEEMDAYYEKQNAFIQAVRSFKHEDYRKNGYFGEIHSNVFIEELGGEFNPKFDFFKAFESELYVMASCQYCGRYYHESQSSAASPDYYCSSSCEHRESDDDELYD